MTSEHSIQNHIFFQVGQVTQLLGSTNTRTLCSLGKYLMQACERRDGT